MSYLVDSDWLIDTLRGVPSAIQVLEEHSVYGLSFSLITLGEVYEGIYDQPDSETRMADLRDLLGDTRSSDCRIQSWRFSLARVLRCVEMDNSSLTWIF